MLTDQKENNINESNKEEKYYKGYKIAVICILVVEMLLNFIIAPVILGCFGGTNFLNPAIILLIIQFAIFLIKRNRVNEKMFLLYIFLFVVFCILLFISYKFFRSVA